MVEKNVAIGLNIPITVGGGNDPVALAVEAERLGFDFVSANDHLNGPGARHETWTMLAWIAASTRRIRVASRVLAVPYRNPAVLAKMAETFDRLSAGRLILGLGAGASEEELAAFGIDTATIGARLTGLEEAIRISHGIWSDERFSFAGSVHRTDAAQVEPKPAHPIPIWVGTHGRRGIELTGRLADGWIASIDLAPPEVAPAMLASLDRAATSAGREPDAITRVYNVTVELDGEANDDPYRVVGSSDAVAERLAGFLDLGFDALNLIPVGDQSPDQLARIGNEVLPTLRAVRT
jgi:alkanesulfonate monooxygenase SsuD/methylene tetrahydromethanopterin reductase-like flavin-dependent oxidoreductase (luciferase family)